MDKVQIKNRSLFYDAAKRFFDIALSLIAGVVLLVPMLAVSAVIAAKDFGSPIYAQRRVGRAGKEIKVYKLRSMKKNSDDLARVLTPEQLSEYKKEYKLHADPRLLGYKKAGDEDTCFGALLRRTSFDETAQILLNVCFLGNMSLVGPRPILKSELEENYTPEEQELLLSVKPGLTGYWQAYARNTVGYENGKRQEMELYYVKNRSAALDIKIIFKTVSAVLKGSGAK